MKRRTMLTTSIGLWGLVLASAASAASSRGQCQPHWCFKTMLPESCVGSPVCPNLIQRPRETVWVRVDPREASVISELTAVEAYTPPAAVDRVPVVPR